MYVIDLNATNQKYISDMMGFSCSGPKQEQV
jgi:hypothetical protein